MSFWRKLLGISSSPSVRQRAPGPISVADPILGELSDEGEGIWLARVPFSPMQRDVEVLMDTQLSSPGPEYGAWFRQIEERYDVLLPAILDATYEQIGEWEGSIERKSLADMLDLETISINGCDQGAHDWQLTYFCERIRHWVTVELSEWNPQHVMIDG